MSIQKKGRKKKGEGEARVGRKEASQSSCKAAQRAGRQGHLSTEGWELEAKTSSHQNYQTLWGSSRWALLLQRAGSGQEHPTLFLPSNSWERNQHAPATDGRPKWVEGPMMGLPPFLSGCSSPGTHSAPHLLSVWAPTAFFSWSPALAPFTPHAPGHPQAELCGGLVWQTAAQVFPSSTVTSHPIQRCSKLQTQLVPEDP